MSITAGDSLAEVRAFIERARERQGDNCGEGELRFGHGASVLRADTMMGVVERCERAEKDLAALREAVATMQPAVQAVWNFLVAQIMPAWRAVEPILAALDGEDDRPAEIPERERLVHDDPVLAAQIREGVAAAGRSESVDLGSFAQYLDEDEDEECDEEPCCEDADELSSHYHCGRCGARVGMMGHEDCEGAGRGRVRG